MKNKTKKNEELIEDYRKQVKKVKEKMRNREKQWKEEKKLTNLILFGDQQETETNQDNETPNQEEEIQQ